MILTPVTEDHVEFLADNLKPDHQRELAWFGRGDKQGVRDSIAACDGHTVSAIHRGRLLFIAGVQQGQSLYGDAAVISYLSTVEFDNHVIPAIRMTRELFQVEVWKHTDKGRIEQYLPPPYNAGIDFLVKLWKWKMGSVVWIGARQAVHVYFDKE